MKLGMKHIMTKFVLLALAILLTDALNIYVQELNPYTYNIQSPSAQSSINQVFSLDSHTNSSYPTDEENNQEDNSLELDFCIILDNENLSLRTTAYKTCCNSFTPMWKNIVLEINPLPPPTLAIVV